jgi:alpha-tubulin suppressor-like RCC1 family protein
LKKRDGSLWSLDASEHRRIKPDSEYKAPTLQRIALDKDMAGFAAGGDNMGAVLTRDGEVWTWGRVIGDHSPNDYYGPLSRLITPRSKNIADPWRVFNIDAN